MDHINLKKDGALVFDFDGTICQLFVNYDMKDVVVTLRDKMKSYGIEFSIEKDIFDVFSEVIRQTEEGSDTREKALFDANQLLTAAETDAVNSGIPVNGVDSAISIFEKKGVPVGISTNNSIQCVEAFLHKNCQNAIIPTAGRVGTKPELMKPNPWSILEVLKKMNRKPENTIFVGDTQRDYFASVNAGCDFIGMAPTVKKRQRLLEILPENYIVSDFNELLTLLNLG